MKNIYLVFENTRDILYRKIQRFMKDEKGSVLPMIAVVLILVIILGAVNFALVVMYRDRAVVRNALDAGATSSLAAVAKEKKKAIIYGETDTVTDTEFVECTCYRSELVGYDDDGEAVYESVPYDCSRTVPTEITWINTESSIKNYVQLNVGAANSVAKDYFEKNMELSNLDYSIKSWGYSAEYDDERIYEVKKDRMIVPIRPAFVPGRRSSGPCDWGVPDEINTVENPEAWWFSDFAGASTGDWEMPPDWTEAVTEEREVIFPRWVEIKASATVELPVPFGSLVGRTTYNASFDVTAFKELIYAIP